MLPRLIGITGLAGAGKDTLADIIVLQRGGTKYNFALPLKQALNATFGWTMEQWDDRVWKETVIDWLGKSPRQCAQTLGTEWGREQVHPGLWMLLAEQRYHQHRRQRAPGPFVIADVRFDNEADMIHANGGVVVKVSRIDVKPINTHISEKGVEAVDFTLHNDSDIHHFLKHGLSVLDNWTEFA